jgi:peptide deformylase
MDLQLVYYPDPRLRAVAQPVGRLDAILRQAVPRMFEIMYRSRGIGLAAPQVGISRRLIVANLTGDPKRADAERVILDPEILQRTGERREEEGCLSLPGMAPVITRAEKVVIRYRQTEGELVEREAEGLEAKLFQHEVDHLDGLLILDKMTPADKKQWSPLLKELEEEFQKKIPRRRRPGGAAAQ